MDTQKALALMAALCSKKEYCRSDIRQKLKKLEVPPEESDRIIDQLVQKRFIDENRFASFYARDKFRFNKWGKLKIIQQLKQKNIPSALIEEAVKNLPDEDYCNICKKLLEQKQKTIKETDPRKRKAKLLRFALGRGFDFGTINACFPEITNTEEETYS